MQKFNFLVLITLFLSTHLFGQTAASKNMQLMGHLDIASWGDVSNIWGYTAPNGIEYAIIGVEMGVSIVSLADPYNPVEVQFLPGIQTIWREIKTFQHYAYVGNEGGNGLRIIDLSNLPNTVNYKDTVIQGISKIHTVSETDGYLYLNGFNSTGGFKIFNLNQNPWIPQYVGQYTTRYVHDCYVRGNTVYAGEIMDGLFTIIDITNKANPQVISSQSYVNSFTHNTWLNDASTHCFTTDEKDAAYVYAWDITDPVNPVMVDGIRGSQSGGLSIPHNIHVTNDYGVTSYYKDGVVIFDVSHPNSLVEVGYYDTFSQGSGGGFDGCWGVYPYLPSGNIIASDITNGLYVLKPDYKRGCFLEGLITDANTGTPIQSASISFTGVNESSLNTGNYAAGVADSGTYQVTYAKAGYVPQTITVTLNHGIVVTQDVQLVPQATAAIGITVLENGTNTPITNAKVDLSEPVSMLLYNFITGANGTINNTVVTSNYTVIAGKWGYKTKQTTLSVTGAGTYTIYLDKGYYDDFYFDYGWTISGNAQRGVWERGEPVGTTDTQNQQPSNPDNDVTSDIGDQCYVTGNGGGNVGDDDLDNGSTIITSPAMDLSAYIEPVIYYNWWFYNADLANQGAINDHLKVSFLNGAVTTDIHDYTGVHNTWNLDSIRVKDFITNPNNIKLVVTAQDITPGHIVEAGFDKFVVIDKAATSISPIADKAVISFQPNPFYQALYLTYDLPQNNDYQLEITDIQGKVLHKQMIDANQHRLGVNLQLPSGFYFARISLNGATIATTKLQKL